MGTNQNNDDWVGKNVGKRFYKLSKEPEIRARTKSRLLQGSTTSVLSMENDGTCQALGAEGNRDDLPGTLKERFDKWVSQKVFVFKGQRFCGKERWGIFDSGNI